MNKSEADQTPDSLNNVSDRLIALAGSIRATAQLMKQAKIDKMLVKNFDALTQGMKKLVSFNRAAENALQDFQENRGDFSAVPPLKVVPSNGKHGKGKTK